MRQNPLEGTKNLDLQDKDSFGHHKGGAILHSRILTAQMIKLILFHAVDMVLFDF